MMKIPYLKPEQPVKEANKAKDLVTQMGEILNLLKGYSNGAGKCVLITPQIRQELRKKRYPAKLVNNIAFFTERVRVPKEGGFVEQDLQMIGFGSDAFDSDLYASDAIKSTLIRSHSGRCAYCETLIHQSAYGDVEHFRPKAGYTTSWSPALFRPAYYNLAYDPANLFYACQLCNEAYKQNMFDVIGARVPDVALDAEVPALINPYLEGPRDMLRFNPCNGRAYAFDLTAAFYAATKGWGAPQTATEIWKDPALIPGQQDWRNTPITHPEVNNAYQKWLSTIKDGAMLRRGTATINTLHLNRPALVRARVSQLRQLRGIVGVASNNTTDQAAAQKLLAALLSGDASAALVAPEYLSLSIDAVQTWGAQGYGTGNWIDNYTQILFSFVPMEKVIPPTPYNDALSYLVLDRDAHLVGQRRLIYISDSDAVYGNPGDHKGLCFAIDWEEDLKNTVIVQRGGVERERMSLLELVNLLNSKPSAYNLFRKNELWVIGNYLPLNA